MPNFVKFLLFINNANQVLLKKYLIENSTHLPLQKSAKHFLQTLDKLNKYFLGYFLP